MTRHRLAKKPLVLALFGIALVAAGLSAAEAARRESRESHDKMFLRHHTPMAEADANGDGSIDASEWNALFAKLDADNSGKIDEGEMARHHGSPPPEAIAFMIAHHADTDRNGQVTSAEWKAHVAELDENDDGELSADELHFRHRSDETGASLPPFAAQWDTDGDGNLGAGELDALFASLDEDKDGVLTFEHMRQMRHERHRR